MCSPEYPSDIVDRYRETVVIEVAEDRCDTCRAEAYVYVEMHGGKTLAYCAHHGTKYWDRLNATARKIIDHRWRLAAGDLPDEP